MLFAGNWPRMLVILQHKQAFVEIGVLISHELNTRDNRRERCLV